MMTRLSNFCDQLLEAGWLAALVIAPLYFNIYSSRVFEPDKASLLRSLALAMIAAWIVRRIEAGFLRAPLGATLRAWTRENPLLLPTLAILLAYLLATIFSVAPNVSFWGSYQRLQGTYSTFSYIVIFLIAASSLRTRAQLYRAINTAIITSFPIAFYGLLQHYEIDPLPWGGDVTVRIAANMGNSIFVAAYLIMTVPLALARWLETLARVTRESSARVVVIAFTTLALIALSALWFFNFMYGVLFVFALFALAISAALIAQRDLRDALVIATYTLILATQVIAIFFSQSRGPLLGLFGGVFVFVVLYALARRARRVALGMIGLAAIGFIFLAMFNLPNSPFAALKSVPYVGRLGQIFDVEPGGTGRVRELIWEGALQLVLPHAPLWSPTTGDDALNPVRPLIGYGPETMYVAFNPFYPPELGRTEARNASPDRAHNETFDALVTTGLFGFAAYILLFVSIFYFGLKWLGLIATPGERNAFIALWLAGGFLSALIFGAARGWNYIGVALPAGMILGFFVFLVGDAIHALPRETGEGWGGGRALWLTALIAALIAHFIEIHFGIAIVATRTYFWFYAALLVVIGMNRLEQPAPVAPAPAKIAPPESVEDARAIARRRKRRPAARPVERARAENELSPAPVLAWTMLASLVLVTLAYEFVVNQTGLPSAFAALERALLYDKANNFSLGVLLLFVLTWIVMGIIGLNEELPRVGVSRDSWFITLALYLIISLTVWVWFVLLQLRPLTQVGDLTNTYIQLLAQYYLALGLLVGALAFALAAATRAQPSAGFAPASLIVAPFLAIALGVMIYATNFAGVQADIYYKAGNNYDAVGQWERSIDAYQRALQLQPVQDFYALFLGRSYLEAGRATGEPKLRAADLEASERMLLTALRMNPLNTDHSANLARLFRLTATMTDNATERATRLEKSSRYYADAIKLSPNTAHLRNEWALTDLLMGDRAKMREQLDISFKLDARFAQTYLYSGEYYRESGDMTRAADEYLNALALDPAVLSDPSGAPLPDPFEVLVRPELAPRAISAYSAALEKNPRQLSARLALVELYKRTGQPELARRELERAVQAAPNDPNAHLSLVNHLSQAGQIDSAVTAMTRLLELYPPTSPESPRLQEFLKQLQNLQRAIQLAKNAPNDANAQRAVAAIWKARGQPQFAIPVYDAIAHLAPNDYDALKNLALLNAQTNQFDAAERALARAATLAPDNEKAMWQNVQAALNSLKQKQFAPALKSAQAALALAGDADKPALQAFVAYLQDQVAAKK
ncbi:MAG: tetratricopeptide repeat protein [Chloroflexi bacterium]|nr:tetratricopeptide repeat protein [Chloroflexota bacterium]